MAKPAKWDTDYRDLPPDMDDDLRELREPPRGPKRTGPTWAGWMAIGLMLATAGLLMCLLTRGP